MLDQSGPEKQRHEELSGVPSPITVAGSLLAVPVDREVAIPGRRLGLDCRPITQ
jgi:hypothetical protein